MAQVQKSAQDTGRKKGTSVDDRKASALRCCCEPFHQHVREQHSKPHQDADLRALRRQTGWLQDKRKAEEERQKELNELFAQAIKQPKLPVGELALTCRAKRA